MRGKKEIFAISSKAAGEASDELTKLLERTLSCDRGIVSSTREKNRPLGLCILVIIKSGLFANEVPFLKRISAYFYAGWVDTRVCCCKSSSFSYNSLFLLPLRAASTSGV